MKELDSAHSGHANEGTAVRPHPQGTAGHEGTGPAMRKHHDMMEQMAKESKQKLESASGAAADQVFLQEMSMHHQMAVDMIAKAKLKDANLRKLPHKMAAEQTREIAEMNKLQTSTR